MPNDNADRWQRIEELLSDALDRQPAERDAFLDSACCGDQALRREVDSLLEAHSRRGVLDRLHAQVAPLAAQLQSAPAPDEGRTIGPYQVHERVGGGGMGVVYRARDARDHRLVAIKLMQQRFAADAAAVRRFRLEASTVAALEHRNICSVIDVGETSDGRLYLVMPLYDGETLRERIARGPLPIPEAAGIAVQVARGLAIAHANRIIHRDVKPSNVFLTSDGPVKLLDFGIAKLAGVTLTGSLAGPLGTLSYMSPEQLRGERVDARTDVWSLGVVLYEMLTGRRPFGRGAAGVVVNAIVHGEHEPISRHRSDVPAGLAHVVATALARSPVARYASAQALEDHLVALGYSDDG